MEEDGSSAERSVTVIEDADGLPAGWKKVRTERRSGSGTNGGSTQSVDVIFLSPEGRQFASEESLQRYFDWELANGSETYSGFGLTRTAAADGAGIAERENVRPSPVRSGTRNAVVSTPVRGPPVRRVGNGVASGGDDDADARAEVIAKIFRPHEVVYQSTDGVPPGFMKVLIKRHTGSMQTSVCVVSPENTRLWNKLEVERYIAKGGRKDLNVSQFSFSKFLSNQAYLRPKRGRKKTESPVENDPSRPPLGVDGEADSTEAVADVGKTPATTASRGRRPAAAAALVRLGELPVEYGSAGCEGRDAPSSVPAPSPPPLPLPLSTPGPGRPAPSSFPYWGKVMRFRDEEDEDDIVATDTKSVPPGWQKVVLMRSSEKFFGAFGVFFISPENWRLWNENEVAGYFRARGMAGVDLSPFAFTVDGLVDHLKDEMEIVEDGEPPADPKSGPGRLLENGHEVRPEPADEEAVSLDARWPGERRVYSGSARKKASFDWRSLVDDDGNGGGGAVGDSSSTLLRIAKKPSSAAAVARVVAEDAASIDRRTSPRLGRPPKFASASAGQLVPQPVTVTRRPRPRPKEEVSVSSEAKPHVLPNGWTKPHVEDGIVRKTSLLSVAPRESAVCDKGQLDGYLTDPRLAAPDPSGFSFVPDLSRVKTERPTRKSPRDDEPTAGSDTWSSAGKTGLTREQLDYLRPHAADDWALLVAAMFLETGKPRAAVEDFFRACPTAAEAAMFSLSSDVGRRHKMAASLVIRVQMVSRDYGNREQTRVRAPNFSGVSDFVKMCFRLVSETRE